MPAMKRIRVDRSEGEYNYSKLPKGYLIFAADNIFDREVEINGNKETDNYVYYGMPRFLKA